jgi:hypothetical protein
MKSKSLEEAYKRLWAATENGTVGEDFFELREEARHFLSEEQQKDREAINMLATLMLEMESDAHYENLQDCYSIAVERADRLRLTLTKPQ